MIKKRQLLNGFIFLFLISNIIICLNCILSLSLFAAEQEEDIVDVYGQLRVEGNRIVSQAGDTVAIRGMSLFWSQWIGKYYNSDCIEWLCNDWKCNVSSGCYGC